jgi:hypothetical protein
MQVEVNNSGTSASVTVAQIGQAQPAFVADTGTAAGTKGLVPAPAAGDANANKLLSAAGSFAFVTFSSLASALVAATSDLLGNVASKLVSVASIWSAQAPVTLTYAATVTPDLSTFLNATLTLTGNCTLANPTNAKAGQSGFISITQGGTGSFTLAFGSAWKFSGGPPTASTAAGAVDGISYYVENASTPIIRAAYLKAFA